MLVGERRLVLEKSPWERWPPFPSNHPCKCPPLLPLLLHLLVLLSFPLPSAVEATCERNPVRGIKGENTLRETLILINCLIFPRDVRDALSCADLVYISLERHPRIPPRPCYTREFNRVPRPPFPSSRNPSRRRVLTVE